MEDCSKDERPQQEMLSPSGQIVCQTSRVRWSVNIPQR